MKKEFYTAPQAEQIELNAESCVASSPYSVGRNSMEDAILSEEENW
jgi:hypothetical protein